MRIKNVIGIGGVARAGKDTFAAILESILVSRGKTVRKIALADPLKADCDAFLQKHLNISAFTQVPEEKVLIRPMLVWYGDAQRKRTNGRYWVELASKTINESEYDYYIITDVRYDHYEKDELYWLKNEWNGVLCHVSKWQRIPIASTQPKLAANISRQFVAPANDHEAMNDPKIKSGAHHLVEWEHVVCNSTEELLKNTYLVAEVDLFARNWIKSH